MSFRKSGWGGTTLRALSVIFTLSVLSLAFAASAQTSNSADETFTNLYTWGYNTLRWPFLTAAMTYAGYSFFFGEHGKRRAVTIALASLVLCLIPFWVSLYKAITGS